MLRGPHLSFSSLPHPPFGHLLLKEKEKGNGILFEETVLCAMPYFLFYHFNNKTYPNCLSEVFLSSNQ